MNSKLTIPNVSVLLKVCAVVISDLNNKGKKIEKKPILKKFFNFSLLVTGVKTLSPCLVQCVYLLVQFIFLFIYFVLAHVFWSRIIILIYINCFLIRL